MQIWEVFVGTMAATREMTLVTAFDKSLMCRGKNKNTLRETVFGCDNPALLCEF